MRLFFALAMLSASLGVAEEKPVEIPLKSIWALDMPGTRDVRKLDPRKTAKETAITRIGHALMIRNEERERAGPCFLVQGEGKASLRNAAEVIAKGASPAKVLPAGKEISLVFYSYAAPGYVHLHSVHHSKGRVTIRYKVVIHQSSEVTVHFALIPLGKLPAGRVTVEAVEVASNTPYPNHALTDRATCDSCSFVIRDETRRSKEATMRTRFLYASVAAISLLAPTIQCYGDTKSIGPDGINATGLTLPSPNNSALTGDKHRARD